MAIGSEPQTVRGFAAWLHINKPAVTRGLDWLGILGLTERQDDPDDGRSVWAVLTPRGVRYVVQVNSTMSAGGRLGA